MRGKRAAAARTAEQPEQLPPLPSASPSPLDFAATAAERLRQRWILPSAVDFLPSAVDFLPSAVDFPVGAAGALEPDHKCFTWNNPDSRPVPERRILPPLLLPSTRTADPCRNGGSCRRCCCHQPGQPTRAGTVDFAAALRRRWILPPLQLNACGNGGFCRRRWIFCRRRLLPEQLNTCGGGGFCRRCCWSPRTRPAERLRRRWILPPLLLEPSNPTSRTPAATVDFAVAAVAARTAERLRQRWICRRCCWSPRTRTAERLRQRWICRRCWIRL